MNARQMKLLELLMQSHAGMTGDELSKLLGVSSRTIRSDMKAVAAELAAGGAKLHAQLGSGYRIEVQDAAAFAAFLPEKKAASAASLMSPEERAHHIMKKLLLQALQNRPVKQSELADEIFVSLSTLKAHLKEAEKKFARYGLRVERYKTQGIRLAGDEAQIRYCISEHLFERQERTAARLREYYRGIFQTVDFDRLEKIVVERIAARRVKFTDTAIQNILIHIAIAVVRAGGDGCMRYMVSQAERMEARAEFALARDLAGAIGRELGIDLQAGEVYYIAQHLIAGKKFGADDAAGPADLDGLMEKIFQRLREAVGIDFSADDSLRKWLSLHLQIALTRMKLHMNIRNEVLPLVKNEYPLAFQIAVVASKVIESEEGLRVGENEIGYIAVHFGAALSRRGIRGDAPVKRALLVCASGVGMAVLLKARLEECFKGRIQVVRTMPGYEVDAAAVAQADVILTTIPLPDIAPDKVIRVAHLLGGDEIAAIERRIFGQPADEAPAIREFFRADCFYRGRELKSKREVLDFLTGELIGKGLMNEATRRSVFEREEASSTEIGNLVAIPHPMYNDTAVSAIGVLVLDKPILWDEAQVQVVFLISIAKEKFKLWETVFLRLFDYLVKENGVKRMTKEPSYEKFLESFAQKFR